jgi:hypothetical protein
VIPFTGHHFGAAVAGGDFNGDGITDLAVGIPDFGSAFNNIPHSGEVQIFFGGVGNGLFVRALVQSFDGFDPPALLPSPGDRYGLVLASGDFNGDSVGDLAIGIPNKKLGGNLNGNSFAGMVHVRYGGAGVAGGLVGPTQVWTQSALFPGDPFHRSEPNDEFGFSLAAGDFNGDGRQDLAIGAPGEDVLSFRGGGSIVDVFLAGEVDVVYGSQTGLAISPRAPQFWTLDDPGLIDASELDDEFGFSLTAWNFGKGPEADLAIGIPFKRVHRSGTPAGTKVLEAGAVSVLYGSPPPGNTLDHANGLTSLGNQFWFAGSPGIPSALQRKAHFGAALY